MDNSEQSGMYWIVAAQEDELGLLLIEFDAKPEGRVGGYPHFVGKAGMRRVRLGVTGVGLASACLAMGGFLTLGTPEAILVTGSAGAFPDSGLNIGDVVVAATEISAESGLLVAPGIGDATSFARFGMSQEIAFDEALGGELLAAAGRAGHAVSGKVLTVMGVSASPEQAVIRAGRFRAVAENMEGYAVALAARNYRIRAAEVRGISNRAGDRNKMSWDLLRANERSQSAIMDYLRGSS